MKTCIAKNRALLLSLAVSLCSTAVHAVDSDGDGVDNLFDNCTFAPNPLQQDTDRDGHGNICDADFDNNCLTNALDLGIFKANPFDPNTDLDSSGRPDFRDLSLFKAYYFLAPGPSAPGSLCNPDTDSDGDGIGDALDLCPDTLPDTMVDGRGCPFVNLVPDSGFEAAATPAVCDLSSGTMSAQWSCFSWPISIEAEGGVIPPARTGTNVLKQSGFDGGAISSSFQVMPGVEYALSAHAMNSGGISSPAGLEALVLVSLQFLNEDGDLIANLERLGTPVQGQAGFVYLAPDVWTELSGTIVAPQDAQTARILLLHLAVNATTFESGVLVPGEVFWDDISVLGPQLIDEPDPSLPVAVLSKNGSFEEDDASSGDLPCADGWTCFGTGDLNFTTFAGGTSAAPGPLMAQQGGQMLRTTGWDSLSGAYQDIDILGGEDYTLRAYAQNSSADDLFNDIALQLIWRDAATNTISTEELVGRPNGFHSADEIDMGGVEDDCGPPEGAACFGGFSLILVDVPDAANMDVWQEFEITATAPANARSVRIQLLHTGAGGNIGQGIGTITTERGSVFWDNVELIGPSDGLSLVWAEEFDDPTLDPAIWSIETGYGPDPDARGWGNDEWQLYSSDSVQIVDTGSESVLRITADCIDAPNCGKRDGSITSGRITTQNKFDFTFGRVEARIRVPNNLSSWPAFWMLGSRISEPEGWPKAGEIDILEVFDDKNEVSGAIHYCNELADPSRDCTDFPSGWEFIARQITLAESVGDRFRVYRLDWTENSIRMTVDGVEYFNQSINPGLQEEFLNDFFLLLNIAVGGVAVSNPSASTVWPMTMDVDYIRVYQ